jgi:hypothetical protein
VDHLLLASEFSADAGAILLDLTHGSLVPSGQVFQMATAAVNLRL